MAKIVKIHDDGGGWMLCGYIYQPKGKVQFRWNLDGTSGIKGHKTPGTGGADMMDLEEIEGEMRGL